MAIFLHTWLQILDKMEAVLDDPYILITDRKISAISDILPILEKVVKHRKELVIIAEDLLMVKHWQLLL